MWYEGAGSTLASRNKTAAWLPINACAAALGLKRLQILTLIEENDLEGAVDVRSPGASRACMRVPRGSVIAYLEAHQTKGKRATKRPRISPTRTRRVADPVEALMAAVTCE